MKHPMVKIAAKAGLTLVFVLLISIGLQFLIRFQPSHNIDIMVSEMSSQSSVGQQLTSEYVLHQLGLDKPFTPDLWPFDNQSLWSSNSSTSPSSSSYASTSAAPSTPTTNSLPQGNIGLSAGGAKDITNFRENIQNDYLPMPTDVTYEGLFYDYYFDTGMNQPCNQLFCPSYATAVTRDPLSRQTEYYLSVGLNSGLKESDFERKQLNLVIVLDTSGSMGEYFDQYYYDRYGKKIDAYAEEGISRKNKIDSAKDAVITILRQLKDTDRFAIVLFNTDATLVKSMGLLSRTNMYDIEDRILNLTADGTTNLDAGMDLGTAQLRGLTNLNSYEYENRIIVLTDAQPNTGVISSAGLSRNVEKNAADRIYTTFIGVGVDFNSQLIETITKSKGANYYSVHSPREFRQRIEEEFDYMVTPLIFNLRFSFESRGWRIDQVFGSPEADSATGNLMTINTLFPSKSERGETKGGLVLLKLRRLFSESDDRIYLRVTYEDRNGRKDTAESIVYLEKQQPEYFDNTGIRKGILLSRYAALLKNWMLDERQHVQYSSPWNPRISERTGIEIPPENVGQWERQSLRLNVSDLYVRIFKDFSRYFANEMEDIGDNTLEQELNILNTLYR
jgi:Ca-activated chloride channel family protein